MAKFSKIRSTMDIWKVEQLSAFGIATVRKHCNGYLIPCGGSELVDYANKEVIGRPCPTCSGEILAMLQYPEITLAKVNRYLRWRGSGN